MSKTTKISEVLTEEIEKSSHSVSFLCDNLRAVLNHSNSVQDIVVLGLIKEAHELRIKIENLKNAIAIDLKDS